MDLGGLTGLSGLSGVAAVIGALGGVVTWLVKRADAAKTEIPRAQAEIAHASASLQGALSTVQTSLTNEVDRLREDRDEDRRRHTEELSVVHARLDALRRDVENVTALWTGWYGDLTERWEEHRVKTDPPPPPRP